MVTVDGIPVVLERFAQGIRDLVTETERILHADCLCGLQFPEFDDEMDRYFDLDDLGHVVIDHPRKLDAGYSFINDPANPFVKYRGTLIRAFLDPSNRHKTDINFHVPGATGPDGSILFKWGAVRNWFSDNGHFLKVQ